jgi:hypothetical protein
MKYMLLIYDNEQDWLNLSEEKQSEMYGAYMKFGAEIQASGNYIAGAQLHPIASATSVRIRDDKQLVVDGPFAETKEQLGGYYVIEAKDLDEATAIAARIPSATMGTVEIRPLVEHATAAT